MHNKEQQLQTEFYKKLQTIIVNYNAILLFGATNVKKKKKRIIQYSSKDHRFANIKIEVKQTDKMTENQRIRFVSDYFETVRA